MRSLTTKLILAFLAVSLISIGAITILTRFATNREFDKFTSNQYEAELVNELAHYRMENGSWENLGKAHIGFTFDQFAPGDGRPPNFAVADANGVVVFESFQFKLGQHIGADMLSKATPIHVENETVGYLLIEQPPDHHDPLQDQFLRRLDTSLFLSAIGTIILALFFGILLSRNITNPVRELTSATHAMADGKLGQKVAVRSKDEIGELAQSFNKMNDDLARSLNLRKQMTADIAHELRTPLSLIIGHAEAVHDGVLPPSKENFEIIREEADRLEQLVNDLRTLSLADAGELSVEFQPVDLNQLLSDVKTHYTIPFNQKRIALDLVTDPVILKANLDPIRFSQVLTNILDNALRYTPEDGRVTISAKKVDNQIEIVIADNGEGVNPEEAAHLFDRFYRADPSRTRDSESGGSGLGLAIAKSIVEMHRGSIRAESEKGKGMKVVILLPKAE